MWNCNEHASYQLSDAYLTKNEKVLLKRMLERRGQNIHFFLGGKRYFYIIPRKVFEHKFILHWCLFIKVWKCNFDTGVRMTIWMNVFTRSMPPTRSFQADNVLPRTFWRYFKNAFLTDCWLTIEFFSVVRIYTLFVMSNHVFSFNIAMMKIRSGTAFWVWNTTRASDAYFFRPRRNRKNVTKWCSSWSPV